MSFSITTWNINSVRLRMPIVEQFLVRYKPDILCLQETKCPNGEFPMKPLKALGYEHVIIHGQKGYHGVAIASKIPLIEDHRQDYCGIGDARHISAIFEVGSRRVRLHNFYVPAGGDEPDRSINPKFGHKLDFIEEMKALRADGVPGTSSILVGDLNIAPLEDRQPYAGGNRGNARHHEEGQLARSDAAERAGDGKDLYLVELSRQGLGSGRSRPPPRPYLVVAGSRPLA